MFFGPKLKNNCQNCMFSKFFAKTCNFMKVFFVFFAKNLKKCNFMQVFFVFLQKCMKTCRLYLFFAKKQRKHIENCNFQSGIQSSGAVTQDLKEKKKKISKNQYNCENCRFSLFFWPKLKNNCQNCMFSKIFAKNCNFM